MRTLTLAAVALLALACGGASQSGPIETCHGITFTTDAGLAPFSGLVYEPSVTLGTGQTMPGPQVVAFWANPGGATSPSASFTTICAQLKQSGFPSSLFVAPATVSFTLGDTLTPGPFQSTIGLSSGPQTTLLEDVTGGVDVNAVSTACLTGDFTADLAAVDPVDGRPLDGGVTVVLKGTFDIPICK